MSVPTKLVTAEEFAKLPDDDYRYELVEGQVIRMPPPGALHGFVSNRVAGELYHFVKERGLGTVFNECGYKLASDPDTVRGPDVSFVRAERAEATGVPRGYWQGPPDLAVEVRSPDDRKAEIAKKIQDYLRVGVRMIWFVEPDHRTVTVYRPAAAPLTLSANQELDGGDVVPGFRLPIHALFD